MLWKHRRLIALRDSGAHRGRSRFGAVGADLPRGHDPPVDRDRGTPAGRELAAAALCERRPGFLPTQTKLMESREIGERVVRKLNLLDNPRLQPEEGDSDAGSKRRKAVPTPRTRSIEHGGLGAGQRGRRAGQGHQPPAALLRGSDAAAGRESPTPSPRPTSQWNARGQDRDVGRASQFLRRRRSAT